MDGAQRRSIRGLCGRGHGAPERLRQRGARHQRGQEGLEWVDGSTMCHVPKLHGSA